MRGASRYSTRKLVQPLKNLSSIQEARAFKKEACATDFKLSTGRFSQFCGFLRNKSGPEARAPERLSQRFVVRD
jgi:hypothetical protein